MKKALLLLLFCCASFLGFSTTWYSVPGGADAAVVGSWWTSTTGTGSNPTAFTGATDTFIVQSNMSIASVTWTIAGSLVFNSGSLTKSATGGTIMNIGNHLVLNGATFITAAAGSGSITINLGGNLAVNGTSYITSGTAGSSFNRINLNNTGSSLSNPQTISWASSGSSFYTSMFINAGCTAQLLSDIAFPHLSDTGMTVIGSLVCGTRIISSGGTSKFTVASGGSLYTASLTGINGNILSMSGTNFSTGGNYIFNGASAQVTGTYLPASIVSGGSVMISNITGVSLTQTTSFAAGASLKLNVGLLNNTSTNLVLASGSNVYRDSGLMAALPVTYTGINLTYAQLGYNAPAVATSNELPGIFTGSLIVNKPGAVVSLNATKAITGDITLAAGTLDASAANYNLSLTGMWNNNATTIAFAPRFATVTVNGSTTQLIGGTAGTTFNNLVLNNAAGAVLGADQNINSTFTLTSGSLTLGANNLVLITTANAIAGAFSASKMIIANGTGKLKKMFGANGTYFYPIGDNTNYTPLNLTLSTGTYGASAYAAVNVKPVKQPNNVNVNNYLNRYWSITTSAITSPTYSVAATYVTGDVTGTEASMSAGNYKGSLPWLKYGATNAVTHTLSATGITSVNADITGITTAGPTVTSSGGAVLCTFTGSAPISVTSVGTDGPFTYTWAPAAGLSATTGSVVTDTPSIAGNTTYTVTVTDGNGFTGTATTVMTVNPSPAGIGFPGGIPAGHVCTASTTLLTDASTPGTWSSSNTLIAGVGSSTGILSGLNVGTAVISYKLTSTGCYTTTVVTVNVTPTAITGPSVVCVNSTISLTDAVPTGVWTSGTLANGTIATSGVLSGLAAGTTTISYSTGCPGIATKVITINPLPAVITGSTPVCVGQVITLADVTAGGTWTSNDTLTARVDTFAGTTSGISLGTTPITYKLPTGCYRTVQVTVNPLAPVMGSDTLCAGSAVFFTDIIGGGTWVSSNPLIASADTFTGHVVGLDSGISYIVYLLPTGCTASRLVRIRPNTPPIMGLKHVCTGSVITLSDAVAAGTWSSDNAFVAAIGSSSGILSGLSTDTVHISYVRPFGCKATTIITVTPLPDPVITYSYVLNSFTTYNYFVTYQWYSKDHGVMPGANGYIFPEPTAYDDSFYVVVTDTNGCTNTSGKVFHSVGIPMYSAGAFSVYPNPSSGTINITAPVRVKAVVSTIDGAKAMEAADARSIDISNLAPGMYFVALYNDEGTLVLMKKIIRQ